MADLRITGVTNNQLELQAPDGTRHYLEISDDLLKAMKSRPRPANSTLTPRDIQAEIRLGTSVEELVSKTGEDEDYIRKFAAPIITELQHIVTLARNIRLSLAGDRFTDPTQIEFGTVMDERLQSNKARDIKWTSRKSVEGDWLVSAEYTVSDTAGVATWSFDPKNLFLVPENQSALLLSNAAPLTLAETRPVAPEQVSHPTNTFIPVEVIDEPATQTAGLTIVPELVEVETTETETSTEVITIVETETRATFHVVEDHVLEQEELVEVVEETPVEVTIEEPVTEQEEPTKDTTQEPYTPTKVQSTSRWAEVLFGTKDEEED